MIIDPYIFKTISISGKYTVAEITNMITTLNYIPVANGTELYNIRLGGSQTMGAGSQWEGSYTVGLDKRYVQINDITLSGKFDRLASFSGIYDGNWLTINNLDLGTFDGGYALFSCNQTSGDRILRNILIIDALNENYIQSASILAQPLNAGYTIEDCYISGTINSTGGSGSGGSRFGGISGSPIGAAIIKRCVANVNIIGIYGRSGGCIGLNQGASIENCISLGTVEGTDRIGGLIGWNLSGSVTNCYTLCVPTGTSVVGGLIGANGGTVTNSYWNTDLYATDNGIGVGKTTTEMKEGSIPDTSIYVSWSPTVWDAVDNSNYPILKTIPII